MNTMTTTPTATPRTDAAWSFAFTASEFSAASAARQMRDKCAELETELAAAKAECNRLYESSPTALDALTAELARLRAENLTAHQMACAAGLERDQLRADLERFTGHGLLDCHAICDQRDAAIARAERAETELAEAKAEAAHYMSVAQKATDELARLRDEIACKQEIVRANKKLDLKIRDSLRAENIVAHQMACVAGWERDQLRAEVERLTTKIANQAERIRYLESATNHASGTPLSQAVARAERAEAERDALRAAMKP